MSTPMFPVPKEAQSPGATDTKWFAGLAMQAIIGKQKSVPDSESEREEIALWSWRMAQAMIATEKRIHAEQDWHPIGWKRDVSLAQLQRFYGFLRELRRRVLEFDRQAACEPGANEGRAPVGLWPDCRCEFDWEHDSQVRHASDLVTYEMHVRGFTTHPSSGVLQRIIFVVVRCIQYGSQFNMHDRQRSTETLGKLARALQSRIGTGRKVCRDKYGFGIHRRTGDPANALVWIAKEENVDLVVMGTHGRTGLMRLLMGSVAEAIVRRAPCSVFTYKHFDDKPEKR